MTSALFALLGVLGGSVYLFGWFLVHGCGAPQPQRTTWRTGAAIVSTGLLMIISLVREICQAVTSDIECSDPAVAVPLFWASVFAPWFLIQYWGPACRGTPSMDRIVLLVLAAAGALGWIDQLHLWSPR